MTRSILPIAEYPVYSGPLGVLFDTDSPSTASFYLWAPTATAVRVKLWRLPDEGQAQPSGIRIVAMQSGPDGSWHSTVDDAYGLAYCYELDFETVVEVAGEEEATAKNWTNESVDPYAKALTANGTAGVVLDPDRVLAEAVQGARPPRPTHTGTPVIYEAHIRDLTIAPDNGIAHKGKFVGLAESGTRTSSSNLSGLDYLAELGITHVQLLPIFDFGSIDELGDLSFDAQYNWGYDPVNYNAPEGSYATNPADPVARIVELRQLIDALHANDMGVIMDVVYNHVYDAGEHCFEKTVPGYYFRMQPDGTYYDGTFCGNESASEHPMVRRFIVDSMVYWARTFGVDGFRMDLMGIHDVDTVNAIRAALDQVAPDLVLIGEGWSLGNHEDGVISADQDAGAQMPRVGMFNDTFRDCMKGSEFQEGARGFINGGAGDGDELALTLYDSLRGALTTRDYLDPAQSVIYNEAHDNATIFDKLRSEGFDVEDAVRRTLFATQVQLLALGTAFLHAGQEFARTKGGDENSYRSPDHVNVFDYDRAAEFSGSVERIRRLIAFRRSQPWLNTTSYEEVRDTWHLLIAEGTQLAYVVEGAFSERAEESDTNSGPRVQTEHDQFERANSAQVEAAQVEAANLEAAQVEAAQVEALPAHSALVVINGSDDAWNLSKSDKLVETVQRIDAVHIDGGIVYQPKKHAGDIGAELGSDGAGQQSRTPPSDVFMIPEFSVSLFELL